MSPSSGFTNWFLSTDDLLQPKNSIATVSVKIIVRFRMLSNFILCNCLFDYIGNALIVAKVVV